MNRNVDKESSYNIIKVVINTEIHDNKLIVTISLGNLWKKKTKNA